MRLLAAAFASVTVVWGCTCVPSVDRCGAARRADPVFAAVVESASPRVDWRVLYDSDEEPQNVTDIRALVFRQMSNLAPEHDEAVRAATTVAELHKALEAISERGVRYRVRVLDAFGSNVPELQDVWSDFSSCGVKLKIGTAYLFRGSVRDGRYQVGGCGATAIPLEDAGRDLAFLLLQKPGSNAASRLAGAVSTKPSDLSRGYLHPSAPVKDASVVIRRNDDVRQAEIDQTGEFIIDGLAPGRYQAEVVANRSGKPLGPPVSIDVPARGCVVKYLVVEPKEKDEEP